MAEAPTPTPSAAPPTQGTAQDATYFQELAKIEHTLGSTLAGDKETLGNLKTSYEYQNRLREAQEPKAYAANRYKALNEGISSSGINAERRGGIGAGFLNQANRATSVYGQNVTKTQRGEAEARERAKLETAGAQTKAEERAKAKLLAESPQTPATYPGLPAGATVTGPPGPGGVVPYETAKVRVGPAKTAAAVPAVKVPQPVGYTPSETGGKGQGFVRVGPRPYTPSETGGRGKGFVRVGTRAQNRARTLASRKAIRR